MLCRRICGQPYNGHSWTLFRFVECTKSVCMTRFIGRKSVLEDMELTSLIRKLDPLPAKQVGVDRPAPGSQERQGGTESS